MYISFARLIVYSSLVYSSPIKPIASAVHRPPSNRIAFAVRSDCVRRPHRQRTENDDKT